MVGFAAQLNTLGYRSAEQGPDGGAERYITPVRWLSIQFDNSQNTVAS